MAHRERHRRAARPAIATFTHGTARTTNEPVLLAADGRTYRTIDDYSRLTAAGSVPLLLAPDGSRMAGAAGQVLDVTTGRISWHPVLASDSEQRFTPTAPLAWSPDGRRLVYEVPPGYVSGRHEVSGRTGTGLALLDLDIGDVEIIETDARSDQRVALSPDGTEIAVSTALEGSGLPSEFARHIDVDPDGSRIMIFGLNGQPRRELSAPNGMELVP